MRFLELGRLRGRRPTTADPSEIATLPSRNAAAQPHGGGDTQISCLTYMLSNANRPAGRGRGGARWRWQGRGGRWGAREGRGVVPLDALQAQQDAEAPPQGEARCARGPYTLVFRVQGISMA